MNSIAVATALYTTLQPPEMIDNPDYISEIDTPDEPEMVDNPDYPGSLASLDANVVTGVGARNANYPCITIMPVDDVPRHFQCPTSDDQADAVSFQTWDLKIWGKSIKEVSEIYDRVIEILETDISTEIAASFRGRGMPLMAEDNRPNEIIYSRVIECEVIF